MSSNIVMPGIKSFIAFYFLIFSLSGCQTHVKTEQVAAQDLLNQYLQQLWKKIETIAEVRFPDFAQQIHRQTSISVDMYLRQNGEMIRLDVVQGSGDAQLDATFTEILRVAAPHPPLPFTLNADTLKISKTWVLAPTQ